MFLIMGNAGFISSAVVCANKHLRCVEPEVIVVFQQQLSALGNLFGDFQVQEPRPEPVVGICIDLNIWALRQGLLGRRGLLRTSRFGLGRRTRSFGWLPTVTPMDPVVHKSSNRRQHSEPRVGALLLVVTGLLDLHHSIQEVGLPRLLQEVPTSCPSNPHPKAPYAQIV